MKHWSIVQGGSVVGRLKAELRDRSEGFTDRMLDVASELEKKRVYARVIDQIVGAGTSVGANTAEADQAISRADFAKCLGVVVKELAESDFWLRTCVRRGWIAQERLCDLQAEAVSLAKIYSRMIVRTRRKPA